MHTSTHTSTHPHRTSSPRFKSTLESCSFSLGLAMQQTRSSTTERRFSCHHGRAKPRQDLRAGRPPLTTPRTRRRPSAAAAPPSKCKTRPVNRSQRRRQNDRQVRGWCGKRRLGRGRRCDVASKRRQLNAPNERGFFETRRRLRNCPPRRKKHCRVFSMSVRPARSLLITCFVDINLHVVNRAFNTFSGTDVM